MVKIKQLLSVIFIIALFPVTLFSSSNENVNRAVSFIENNTKKVLEIKGSEMSQVDRNKTLRLMFNQIIDVKWLTGFSLGKYWHQITKEQKIAYRSVYSDYIFSSYLRKFNDFTTINYRVIGGKSSNSNYYTVTMSATNNENKEITIIFRVKKIDNEFKIRDIVVEGISNAQAQRSEFSSIVAQSGIEHLIDVLKEKI